MRTALLAAVVAAIVAVGVAVPATYAVIDRVDSDGTEAAPPIAATEASTDSPPMPGDVSELAAQVSPAVAFVEVAVQQGQGSGSAVIIDSDGFLLTNAHVVRGADAVRVTLADGSRHDAEVVGEDPTSDIAVLQIDATSLPALDIASDIDVGAPVLAIGSPFGLEGSVTSGIVSALDRSISDGQGSTLTGLVQTDAAINPGNSGGALVDGEGRLVGINTAIFSTTGASAGIGFAVPAATASAIAGQLIDGGVVTYAQLGVSGSDVTPAIASAYELDVEEGALVAGVVPGSGAEEAGIEPGDVIVEVDGERVASMTQLTGVVRQHAPGDQLTLTLSRDGQPVEVLATLGQAD